MFDSSSRVHRHAVLGVLGVFLATCLVGSPSFAQNLPEVVARVEGYEIGRAELMTQAEILRVQITQSGQPDPSGDPGFYRQVLEGLVGELLVYADAKKRGAAATPEDVDGAIAGMAKRFSGPEAFESELKKQGTSLSALREQLERTLTIEKVVRDEISAKVKIADDAAYKFWQQNPEALRTAEQRRVRHIFLQPEGEGGWAKARSQGEILRDQIADGGDFADLARRHSDDAGSAERGGELGWIEAGAATSRLAQAALAMDPGKGAVVVETEDGVHVLDLIEVRPSRVPSFEESGAAIEKKLREYLIQTEIVRRTEELRGGAEIEILI